METPPTESGMPVVPPVAQPIPAPVAHASRRKKGIVVGLVLAALLIGGYLAWASAAGSWPFAPAGPTGQSPSPSPESGQWKTYEDTDEGFSVQYPADWVDMFFGQFSHSAETGTNPFDYDAQFEVAAVISDTDPEAIRFFMLEGANHTCDSLPQPVMIGGFPAYRCQVTLPASEGEEGGPLNLAFVIGESLIEEGLGRIATLEFRVKNGLPADRKNYYLGLFDQILSTFRFAE